MFEEMVSEIEEYLKKWAVKQLSQKNPLALFGIGSDDRTEYLTVITKLFKSSDIALYAEEPNFPSLLVEIKKRWVKNKTYKKKPESDDEIEMLLTKVNYKLEFILSLFENVSNTGGANYLFEKAKKSSKYAELILTTTLVKFLKKETILKILIHHITCDFEGKIFSKSEKYIQFCKYSGCNLFTLINNQADAQSVIGSGYSNFLSPLEKLTLAIQYNLGVSTPEISLKQLDEEFLSYQSENILKNTDRSRDKENQFFRVFKYLFQNKGCADCLTALQKITYFNFIERQNGAEAEEIVKLLDFKQILVECGSNTASYAFSGNLYKYLPPKDAADIIVMYSETIYFMDLVRFSCSEDAIIPTEYIGLASWEAAFKLIKLEKIPNQQKLRMIEKHFKEPAFQELIGNDHVLLKPIVDDFSKEFKKILIQCGPDIAGLAFSGNFYKSLPPKDAADVIVLYSENLNFMQIVCFSSQQQTIGSAENVGLASWEAAFKLIKLKDIPKELKLRMIENHIDEKAFYELVASDQGLLKDICTRSCQNEKLKKLFKPYVSPDKGLNSFLSSLPSLPSLPSSLPSFPSSLPSFSSLSSFSSPSSRK